MAPQYYDWTCSACALDWVLRSTGTAPAHTREEAVLEIGYPHNINAQHGLMDGSGARLQQVYDNYSWR